MSSCACRAGWNQHDQQCKISSFLSVEMQMKTHIHFCYYPHNYQFVAIILVKILYLTYSYNQHLPQEITYHLACRPNIFHKIQFFYIIMQWVVWCSHFVQKFSYQYSIGSFRSLRHLVNEFIINFELEDLERKYWSGQSLQPYVHV